MHVRALPDRTPRLPRLRTPERAGWRPGGEPAPAEPDARRGGPDRDERRWRGALPRRGPPGRHARAPRGARARDDRPGARRRRYTGDHRAYSRHGGVPVLAVGPRQVARAAGPRRRVRPPGVGAVHAADRRHVDAPARVADAAVDARSRRRGFTVVAGTDPLPFAGQEAVIGRYGIAAGAALDADAPGAGLRACAHGGCRPAVVAGRRDSVVSVATRLVRHRLGR